MSIKNEHHICIFQFELKMYWVLFIECSGLYIIKINYCLCDNTNYP